MKKIAHGAELVENRKQQTGRLRGQYHQNAVLTDAEVELVRQLRDDGMTWNAIAEKMDAGVRTIRDICAGRRR